MNGKMVQFQVKRAGALENHRGGIETRVVDGMVVMEFSAAAKSLGFTPEQAIKMGDALILMAKKAIGDRS